MKSAVWIQIKISGSAAISAIFSFEDDLLCWIFIILLYYCTYICVISFPEYHSFYSDTLVLKGRAVSSWFLNRLVLLGFRLRVGTDVQWRISVRKPPSCRGLQAAAGRALRHLPEPQQEAAAVSEKNGHWYGKSEHESTPSMYCNARPIRAYSNKVQFSLCPFFKVFCNVYF